MFGDMRESNDSFFNISFENIGEEIPINFSLLKEILFVPTYKTKFSGLKHLWVGFK